MDFRPLVLTGGVLTVLQRTDTLPIEFDFHSGLSVIVTGESFIIRARKQAVNFVMLTLDGDFTIEGDLWLA